MSTVERKGGSWIWATVDTVLSILALSVIWYPALHYTNSLAGSPLSESYIGFIIGVLALGTAYPFVARDFSLGDLGEYLFLFLATALGWGILWMVATTVSGIALSSSNPIPQAVVWGLAYVTAYVIVFRTNFAVFR